MRACYSGRVRLFCAIEPSDELRTRLVEVPRAIAARGFRAVERSQLHLTMRFLGDVDDARFPSIGAALESAAARVAPFSVAVIGVGTFAPRGSPRVLWAGVDDGARLVAKLAAAIDQALDPIVGKRDIAFKPHITLGRGKEGANVDISALESTGALGALDVRELVLFESALASTGAVHIVRARVLLGA